MKKNSRQILDFWVDPCSKYGSLNFDQNALTDTGQSVISLIDNFIATGIIRIKVQNRKLEPVQKEARRKSEQLIKRPDP